MKSRFALFLSSLLSLSCISGISAEAENPAAKVEKLTFERAGGATVLKDFSAVPNSEGIGKTYEVSPGDFEMATYWAPFQKYDFVQGGKWHNGMNRLQPLAVRQFDEMKEGGVSVLFKLRDGQYFGTWEEYRGNYNEQKLIAMIKGLNTSGVPIRWIQVGAGHHEMKSLGNLGKGGKSVRRSLTINFSNRSIDAFKSGFFKNGRNRPCKLTGFAKRMATVLTGHSP